MLSLAIAALVVTVTGQTASLSSIISITSLSFSSASPASTDTTTHTVLVAKGNHAFAPDVVYASPGDIIGKSGWSLRLQSDNSEYHFYPTNHSVNRAEYGYPCVPYELIHVRSKGFSSGFKPVDAVLGTQPTWQLKINNTDPIFYYCGAPNSCIGYGMVGAINPNASTSFEVQKQLAQNSTFMLNPGEKWPDEGSIPSGVATTTSSPGPTSAIPTPSSTPTVLSKPVLGTGAIAGIAIGGAAVLLLAGIAIWFCGRFSRKSRAPAQEYNPTYPPMSPQPYNKHASQISYSMPPGYDPRSPAISTPVDPRTMHSGSTSPNLSNVPNYNHFNPNM